MSDVLSRFDGIPPDAVQAPAATTVDLSRFDGVPPTQSPAPSDGVMTPAQIASGINPYTGRKLEVVSTADPNSPIVQSMDKMVDSGRVPGPVTQAAISLPTDQEAKTRVAAGQLFPGMDPKQAQGRFFYGPDGRLAAVDPEGKPFYVEPETPDPSRPSTLAPGNMAAVMGSGAGPALPAIGGAVGGMVGTPGSPTGSIAMAGAGAALGDQVRQYGARLLDPSPPSVSPLQTAGAAATGAIGQAGGVVLNGLLAPNPLRVPGRDLTVLRTPEAQQQIAQAYDRASAQGVDLSPGQASGARSLLQYEDAAQTNPLYAGEAADWYRKQGNQLTNASNALLDQVSPVANKTEAAQQFQQGADDAISGARRLANAAARPSYEAAQRGGQVMSPDLAQLADVPAVRTAMDRARVEYQNFYRTPAPETPDFRLWDLTKRQLDDAHTVAQRAGERTTAAGVDSLRRDMVTHLDTAYPQYAQARATAAPGQQLAARLEDSGTGATSAGIGAERAKAITGPIFNQNPQAVAESRQAFEAAGRGNEWMAGVRAHLQDAFEKASMSQQGLNPAMLRRQVWANVDNRDAMQAAMTPTQFQGFDNFMRTVEDAARTFPQNSLTAMRGNANAAVQQAGAEQPNVMAWQAAGNITSPWRIMDLPGKVMDAGARRAQAANVSRIMGDLFSPQGEAYLREMAAVSPGSQRAIAITSQFMTRGAGALAAGATGAARSAPQDSPNFLNSAINPGLNALFGTSLPVWSRTGQQAR